MKDLTQFDPSFKTLIGFLTGKESSKDEKIIMSLLLSEVSAKTGIPESDIMRRTRKREITEARHIFFKAARVQGITFENIGCFAGVGYATVMHGCNNVDEIPSLRKKYNDIY